MINFYIGLILKGDHNFEFISMHSLIYSIHRQKLNRLTVILHVCLCDNLSFGRSCMLYIYQLRLDHIYFSFILFLWILKTCCLVVKKNGPRHMIKTIQWVCCKLCRGFFYLKKSGRHHCAFELSYIRFVSLVLVDRMDKIWWRLKASTILRNFPLATLTSLFYQ